MKDQIKPKYPTSDTHSTVKVDGTKKTVETDSGYLYGDIAIVVIIAVTVVSSVYMYGIFFGDKDK
ncbi:MAG: hypothetical protein J7L15_01910 [Clostridiales bacterium]|nr:hypothetical protein [Clostridiales bacterium]